ncbi:hypothetical protein WKW77_34055 [Variovorax ureilyticus]|uniref:Chromosome partitioning protein ParB n=1 Tax=Variovorax ureilyticus TaxID=1836198 RepID=A0ABU8VR12_9BURK
MESGFRFLDSFVRCSTRKEMEMNMNVSAVLIDANTEPMTDSQIPPWESLDRDLDVALETLAEAVRAENWNWVVCERGPLALDLQRYGAEAMAQREPTPDEVELLARLGAERKRFISAHDANEAERDLQCEVYCSQEQFLASAIDEVQDRIEAAEDALREWRPEQVARLGAVVCIDATGAVIVHRGVFRRGQRPTGGGASRRQAISPQLMRDLTAHRTAALQAKVMMSTEAALAILARRMVETLFDRHGGPGNDVVKVHLQPTTDETLSSDATGYEHSPAGWLLTNAHTEWAECLPARSDALLRWLLDQDQETVLSLLAYCTARSINATSSVERTGDDSEAFAQALHLDMADWWVPTVDNYLRHVSRREAVAAVREATGQDCTSVVSGMSRSEATRHCAARLEGTRWLPEALRPRGIPTDTPANEGREV